MSKAALTIHDVLAQFREKASSKRDLGDRFERLVCAYQPRYILNLFKRVIRVSLETNRIVAALPPLHERP